MGAGDVAEEATARVGALALSHPIVVCSLGVWLVNDHVLKAAYGTWWTGKLTDVVALVVFPVLIAAVLERFIDRPLAVALGFTTLFYSAINLWAPADHATEWMMSLFIDSRLTRDPTDLLVLPALAGAWWVWQRPQRASTSLRRSWGRLVFVIGVATTLATSPAVAVSEVVTGTILLTVEEPSVAIAYTVLHDGGVPGGSVHMFDRLSYTSFALDPDVRPLEDAVSLATTDLGDGKGEVVLTLHDLDLAPVEAVWTLFTEIEGAGGLFSGGVPDPTLTVSAPPDETGPAPLATLTINQYDPEPVRSWEWVVTVPSDQQVAVRVPASPSPASFSLGTSERPLRLTPGFLTPVPAPRSCTQDPCTFSIWISTNHHDPGFNVDLFGPDDIQVADPVQQSMYFVTRTIITETVATEHPIEFAFVGELLLPKPSSPIDEVTQFFQIYVSSTAPGFDLDDDDLRSEASAVMGEPGINLFGPQPVSRCCEPLDVTMRFVAREARNEYNQTEAAAEVTVNFWALNERDPNEIELTFGG